MSAQVRLTSDEILEIHDLIAFVLRRAGEEANPALRSALKKLRRAGLDLRCRHCGERMTRRKDRICDPCNTYSHVYGKMPPDKVLAKRRSA